jgi:hypothetical protein
VVMMVVVVVIIIVDCCLDCRGVEPASSIFIPEIEASDFCHIR